MVTPDIPERIPPAWFVGVGHGPGHQRWRVLLLNNSFRASRCFNDMAYAERLCDICLRTKKQSRKAPNSLRANNN